MSRICSITLISVTALICIASYVDLLRGSRYSSYSFNVTRKKNPLYRDILKYVLGQKNRKEITVQPLIHSVGIHDSKTFVLFSRAFEKGKIIHCTVNRVKTPGKKIFTEAFQCDKPENISGKDLLSVETPSGQILPSITIWDNRYGLKYLGYSNLSLCIVAMVKNEEERIEDWILYHLRQGVEILIIYDNNCTDRTVSVLQKYKEVIVIDWPWHKTQGEAFLHGMLYVKEVCTWALFNDVDEYVFPVANNASLTVQQMLSHFPYWMENKTLVKESDKVSQICFETKVMGTSKYIKCPNLTIPEAYIHFDVWWYKIFGKCAIQPSQSLLWTMIHRFKVRGKTFVLPREYSHLVHYKYQCWEYYMTKWDKGRSGRVRDWDKRKLNRSRPHKQWTKKAGPVDTAFRDYKRIVDQWLLAK